MLILQNLFWGKVQMLMLASPTPETLLFTTFKRTNNAVSSDAESTEHLFTDELSFSNHSCIFLYCPNEDIMAFLHCWLHNEHPAKRPDHAASCLDRETSWANTQSTISHTTRCFSVLAQRLQFNVGCKASLTINIRKGHFRLNTAFQ